MCSIKMQVRNNLISKKKQFNDTQEYRYALEASVMKGVYIGIGGSKVVPLPPYCSTITKVTSEIVKAKLKFDDNICKNLDRICQSLKQDIKEVDNAAIVSNNGTIFICVKFKHLNNTYKYKIDIPIKNRNIAEICTLLISNIDLRYSVNDEKLRVIADTLDAYLYLLDRRMGNDKK